MPAEVTATLCVSLRSMSAKSTLPVALDTASSATAPLAAAAVIAGASFAPVMVMVTCWVAMPPWPSSSVSV